MDVVRRDCKDTKTMPHYLDKELYPVLGDGPMREVRAADVQRTVFDKRDHGFPAAAGIRNMCKRMWDYALVRGVVDTNPAVALPVRFITKARPRTQALSRMKSAHICKRFTSPESGGNSSWRCI